MAPAARTVRRLRLRAPSEAAVRRTARVVEDALRIATLPDTGGRMLLVRRLALGQLPPDAQPMRVALALEEAVMRVGVEWRHGGAPDASAALAVWFRDPLEAHLALARRLLAGQRPSAWYWPLAVPAWRPEMTAGDGVRAIAHSLAAREAAPVALPRWFAALVDGGYGGALAAALRDEDVEPLGRAAGVGEVVRARSGDPAPRGGDVRAARAGEASRGVQRLIAAMVRRDRLGTSGQSWGSGDPVEPIRTDHVALGQGSDAASITSTSSPGESLWEVGPAAETEIGTGALSRSSAHHPRPAASRSLRHTPPGGLERGRKVSDIQAFRPEPRPAAVPVDPTAAPRHPITPDSPPGQAPTTAGGLLFLLNALARAGYADWIARQPDWEPQQVARRTLARVMTALRVPDEDPAWEAVRFGSALPAAPRRFIAPPRWRDGLLSGRGPLRRTLAAEGGRLRDPSGRLLLAGWRGPRPRPLLRDLSDASPSDLPIRDLADEVVEAWEIALRRWLRRFARLPLAPLVLRPGAMAATPTHIDVHFDLASADPRIRRAGLDLDPGWTPWFGRVVAFHYERGGAP